MQCCYRGRVLKFRNVKYASAHKIGALFLSRMLIHWQMPPRLCAPNAKFADTPTDMLILQGTSASVGYCTYK